MLVKKYALVSTSFWDGDNWKNFHILRDGLSEEDVLRIKHNFDEYLRLWKECYQDDYNLWGEVDLIIESFKVV